MSFFVSKSINLIFDRWAISWTYTLDFAAVKRGAMKIIEDNLLSVEICICNMAIEAGAKFIVTPGLDEEIVETEKAAFLFYSFVDFLQRRNSVSRKEAKATAKKYFSNPDFMKKIDNSLVFIKQNNGRIYSLLASAFAKRSVFMTLTVLFVQKLINERNS